MISVQSLHTFQLQANAKRISVIEQEADLKRLATLKTGIDFVLLGEGSNSVFIEDYFGEVIKLALFGKRIEETEAEFLLEVCASENWHEFVLWTLENQIYGFENLALIPGTVGACPIQNIGAYGVEVKEFIKEVEYFDTKTGLFEVIPNLDCDFGYRDSVFKHELKHRAIITKVRFAVPKAWSPVCTYGDLKALESPSARDIFEKVIQIRQSKLPNPNDIGNAGSFFKNPIVANDVVESLKSRFSDIPVYPIDGLTSKLAAGWLIDQCGLKGFTIDGVKVHEKQALVLVNSSGDATGDALFRMIAEVQSRVEQKFGVHLEPEVRLIGKSGEVQYKRRPN